MNKRLGIIYLTIIAFTSCSSIPKTVYKDKGLNFKITEDFRIGKPDFFKKNQATYIPIYIRDKNVYAKFSIVWIPCRSDLDWEIQNYVDGLNSVYNSDSKNKPVYSEIRSTKFGSNDARQIDYVVKTDGPRVGSYTVFFCDNNTVIIGQHSTVDTQAITNKCRELIETTYNCTTTDYLETKK